MFTSDDLATIVDAVGETVTIGGVSCTGDFRVKSQPVQLFDGSVMSSLPTLRITPAVYTARAVDIGTAVTARGINYTVAEPPAQEQSGLWLLTLTKA